ncbi:lysozyme inhibitor LprI family protein [Shewanella marina]|uniref:lysozyme inhibitor LprI family protein n=1 Tax=Shewanella marina TaxID=487319 RepID=UPI0004729115|nr:lysozyme inhibitor LprI family protein [Shewanella marina]
MRFLMYPALLCSLLSTLFFNVNAASASVNTQHIELRSSQIAPSQSITLLLQQANQLFEQGQTQLAQNLYVKAAQLDSGEAYYQLAYRYVVSNEQAINYYEKAVQLGYSPALDDAIEVLFTRARYLQNASPERALELVKLQKKQQPHLAVNSRQSLQQCVNAGTFNLADLTEADQQSYLIHHGDIYQTWQLAERVSHNPIYANKTNQLVLQIICRGSEVPAELETAVEERYQFWLQNYSSQTFNICHYITSGMGMSFCANRDAQKQAKQQQLQLSKIKQQLLHKPQHQQLLMALDDSYNEFATFAQLRAIGEQLYAGTSRSGMIIEDINQQKQHYIDWIYNQVALLSHPVVVDFSAEDKALNQVYRQLRKNLRAHPVTDFNISFHFDDLKQTQRAWLNYRDSTAHLLSLLTPNTSKQQWQAYLTQQRLQQLKELQQQLQNYNSQTT